MSKAPRLRPATGLLGRDRWSDVPGLAAAAAIEPLLRIADLERILSCSRREIERMRAAGRLPKPDLIVGRRSPRWKAATIRDWIDSGGKGAA